jgi:hypothetical protein
MAKVLSSPGVIIYARQVSLGRLERTGGGLVIATFVGICRIVRGCVEIIRGIILVLIFAALLFSSQLALAQFTQQGPKLVGTGAVGPATQGQSVALSGDGNTAIVGGNGDNETAGAAWVYTRGNGVWTQQGSKLVGTGGGGQGSSVSLSADGDTAIVGGVGAWVYTRSGDVWTQQGSKLVGTGAVGSSQQGWSRCPPTATPPSWAALLTTQTQGRRESLSSRRCKSAPPPTLSPQAILADPSPPHHSNIN